MRHDTRSRPIPIKNVTADAEVMGRPTISGIPRMENAYDHDL